MNKAPFSDGLKVTQTYISELFDLDYMCEGYLHDRYKRLEGKSVFYADTEEDLKQRVCTNDTDHIGTLQSLTDEDVTSVSFNVAITEDCSENYNFIYYDPLYTFKRACLMGKRVQYRFKGEDDWKDLSEPVQDWDPGFVDSQEYRILDSYAYITNRQLSRWLAKGNGEKGILIKAPTLGYSFQTVISEITVNTHHTYPDDLGDRPVDSSIVVRKWKDESWHEPTEEYCL